MIPFEQIYDSKSKTFYEFHVHKRQVLLHCSAITVEYGGVLHKDAISAQLARLSEHAEAAPAVVVVAKFEKLKL